MWVFLVFIESLIVGGGGFLVYLDVNIFGKVDVGSVFFVGIIRGFLRGERGEVGGGIIG